MTHFLKLKYIYFHFIPSFLVYSPYLTHKIKFLKSHVIKEMGHLFGTEEVLRMGEYLTEQNRKTYYSLCYIVVELFYHFGTFHNSGVIFFFCKSQHIFLTLDLLSLNLFSLYLSTFFVSCFILSLLNLPNIIFLKSRTEISVSTTMEH